jgi:hypothetical protein
MAVGAMDLEQSATLLDIRLSIKRIGFCDDIAPHYFARQRGILNTLRNQKCRRRHDGEQ